MDVAEMVIAIARAFPGAADRKKIEARRGDRRQAARGLASWVEPQEITVLVMPQ